MREHSSHESGTYGRFLHDLEAARLVLHSKVKCSYMHPDTAKALGIDATLVDQIMSGEIADHPTLAREEMQPGKFALRILSR